MDPQPNGDRDAAKAGNAEAKALVDAVAAKFKDVDPDEAEEKIADLFETYILRRNDVAPEDAPLIERLIDYIRKLFGAAETEARRREDRETMATQFLRDLTHGATLDDAVANDEARTEQAAQGEVEAEESVRSSARRTKQISMTPQEKAKFMAAFRENERDSSSKEWSRFRGVRSIREITATSTTGLAMEHST